MTLGGRPDERVTLGKCAHCGFDLILEDGLCSTCHWRETREAVEGIRQLEYMLASHARYQEWCRSRGVEA